MIYEYIYDIIYVRKFIILKEVNALNDILLKVFEKRNYDADFLNRITACNHRLPGNIHKLCSRLEYYRESQDLIVIVTDFDLDGIMSGTVALSGFAELGFNVALYIYDVSYGYGFTEEDVINIRQQHPNVKAIITGDVGITANKGVAAAKAAGLEVFVTDHHKVGGVIPNADIIVDPFCDGDDYNSYTGICGANVMYQILSSYAEYHVHENRGGVMSQIERLRVFAGFGTISDAMPVYHENRPLIQDAVSICKMLFGESSIVNVIPGSDIYRRAFLGLYNLLIAYKDAGKISLVSDIDEDFVGYYVAPMFNSIKRMDGDLHMAYDVFFGGDEASKKAIAYLFDLNEQRKAEVIKKSEEMYACVQPWEPYVYITDASVGIRGLLAQNVMTKTGLPAMVIGKNDKGTYSGSGRCPGWFLFLDETAARRSKKGKWWAAGHNPAFGFGCDTDEDLDALVKFIKTRSKTLMPDDELIFKPDFTVSTLGDGDFDLDFDLLSGYLNELNMCKPFGAGFPKPVSVFRFYASECIWTVIGKDRTHVKIVMPTGISILCFNQAELFTAITSEGMIDTDELPEVIDVVGDFCFNEFNDTKSLQFLGRIDNEAIAVNHEFMADVDDSVDVDDGFTASEGIVLGEDLSGLLSIAQASLNDKSNKNNEGNGDNNGK